MRISGVEAEIDLAGGTQFVVLGQFWRAMAEQAKGTSVSLRGVGHSWHTAEQSFRYLIGATEPHGWDVLAVASASGLFGAHAATIELPRAGWSRHTCQPDEIASMYDEIWRHGDLRYEVEHFADDGTFATEVLYRE